MDCPVCGAKAEQMPRTLEGDSIRCPSCGEYDISGTATTVREWQEMEPDQRRAVLTKAKELAEPGKRPKITTYLF
jgi:hypothetical protein